MGQNKDFDEHRRILEQGARREQLTLDTEPIGKRFDESAGDAPGFIARLPEAALFASAAAEPFPDAAARLSSTIKDYAASLAANPATHILVLGHTDSSGDPVENQVLSEQRADAVARILVAAGIPHQNLYVIGAGARLPMASNDDSVGRQKNRRVELIEMRNEADLRAYLDPRLKPDPPASPPPLPVPPPPSVGAEPGHKALRPAYDFEGTPVSNEANVVSAVGPPLPACRSAVIPCAIAAQPVIPCYRDPPSVHNNNMLRYDAISTENYYPGLFGAAWSGNVGVVQVGIGPVSVLRQDARPVSGTIVYLRVPGTSPLKFSAVVNTYDGGSRVYYRLYVEDAQAPLYCIDLALPKNGGTTSPAGWAYYKQDGQWKQASFRPKLVMNPGRRPR